MNKSSNDAKSLEQHESTVSADNSGRMNATYHTGATTIYSCRADNRFCFSLYVPHRLDCMERSDTRILVAVHGTGRLQSLYRDLFAEFSEYNNCIVLAPLFPANVLQDGNLSGYKYILERDIRYDQVMIDMIEQVAENYSVTRKRVLMFGFSGGAHFTHRFTLLHPRRILAASIGAPGSVTLVDPNRPWWAGIRDCEAIFGIRVSREDFAGLPLHFVVGEADLETWEITFSERDRYYVDGANDAGANRKERIRTLADSFRMCGARVLLEEVPGATHDVVPIAQKARMFFANVLEEVHSV